MNFQARHRGLICFDATFELPNRQGDATAAAAHAASAVVQAIVEELVIIMVILIVDAVTVSCAIRAPH